jgi:hypothetical protein
VVILAVALGLTAWPVFTLGVVAVLIIGVLAYLRPAWAFVAALGLVGAEGLLKAGLIETGVPLPGGHELLSGALILDLALALAVAGLVLPGRGKDLRALWGRLDRLTKTGIALLGAWVVISLLQILANGSVTRGADGFRLTQAYVGVAAGGAVFLYGRSDPARLVQMLLVSFGVIAAYAALRTFTGPSATERWFAQSRLGVTEYGEAFRAVGSFSGAVGLASYVAPAGVFAYGLALLRPRNRVLGTTVFAAAVVATVGSYSRAGIVALGAGVILVSAIGVRTVFATTRARRVAAVASAAVLVFGAVATVVASQASPVLESRTSGIIHPLSDASMQMRFDTWRESAREIVRHPIGTGLGTVGSASGVAGRTVVTADNSFLKIGREQGLLGLLLFLGGLATLGTAILRRLPRLSPQPQAVAASALAGAFAFLVMCVFGEFVEQPGKVVFWALLGLAVSMLATTSRRAAPSRAASRGTAA